MSVARGVASNAAAQVFQKVTRILDQLLLVPFFLLSWGAAYYGEWLTLTIIPSILAFSDLGFGSAAANSFVLAYASGDRQGAANLRRSGMLIVTCAVALGAVLTVCVLAVGREAHLFDKSLIEAGEAMAAVTFMMVSRLMGFYHQIFEGCFRAARRAATASFMTSGVHVLNLGVGMAVLLCGGGVGAYAFAMFCCAAAYTAFYYFISRRQVDLRGVRGHILKSDIKMMTSKGVGYLMTPIWQSIYFQGGTFVVRVVLGPECVAMFNTVRTVCRSVNQLYSVINGSIFPDLQFEYGRGNMVTARRLLRMTVLAALVLGFTGVLLLLLFGQTLYEWWTASVLSVPDTVWYLFMLGIFFNSMWWTAGLVYRATNHPTHLAVAGTLSAVLSVCASYVLARLWGLEGAVAGTLLFDIVMAAYVLPDSFRMMGMRVSDIVTHIGEDRAFIAARLRALSSRLPWRRKG